MPQSQTARLPEALATGLLAKKPLAHLLVYALDRRLTGTFELVDTTLDCVHIAVVSGLISRVATSQPVIYLGHVLYEAGVIDGDQLSASLAEVATTKRLHGQVLLDKGMLFPTQLADGLREQRARKLQHAFGLSARTSFAFYPNVDLVGERPHDVEPTDPLASIWRGIVAYPSWDHVRATLQTVNGRPLRVVGAVERLGLKPKERTAAELLRRTPSTVPELASGARLDARAAELFAYFLVITKIAEIAERVNVSVPRMDTPITVGHARANAMNTLGATLSSGEYVRKMSFSMRAVTGDQNPLRIPSPMPGTLRIPSPMPGTVGTSGSLVPGTGVRRKDAPPATKEKDSPEAEHALSQAEMHFVLGERDQALAFARKALSEAPTMPEAMAFLGYLEAIGLGKDQEDLLRDFLKMIDAALVRDETCRRGRFYRAELKKRLGDHEGAIRDLRLAVTQDPDDAAAQRELKVYEQKVREGALVVRSMSPFGGTPKPVGFLDRLRNK